MWIIWQYWSIWPILVEHHLDDMKIVVYKYSKKLYLQSVSYLFLCTIFLFKYNANAVSICPNVIAIPIQIWSASASLLFRRIAFAELTAGNLSWWYYLQDTVITVFLQFIFLAEIFENSWLCVGAGTMAVTAFLWLELSCSEWCVEQNLSAFHGCPLSVFCHGLSDTSAILAVSSSDTIIVAF